MSVMVFRLRAFDDENVEVGSFVVDVNENLALQEFVDNDELPDDLKDLISWLVEMGSEENK